MLESNGEGVIVHEITSWSKFLELVSGPYLNWAFRGQENAEWPMWSKLARELRNRGVQPAYWLKQELHIIGTFQRKSYHFVAKVAEIDDTPRWLALMQHHGAPTRLLDFSWSPYVAAFFALEPATKDSAVWAVNSLKLKSYNFGPYSGANPRPISPRQVLSDVGARGRQAVVFGEPYFKNQRLIAQSGTFAWARDITRPLEEILGQGLVAKLVFRGIDVRRQGLAELYRMNITHATLFPDLDGLARSMNYELEFHWAFDPTKPIQESQATS